MVRFFLKPYPWLFGGLFGVTLLTSLLEGLNVAALFPVLHFLTEGGEEMARAGPLRWFIGAVQWLPFRDPVLSALLVFLGITLVRSAAVMLREGFIATASGTVQYDVRNRLMACYADSDYSFLLDHKQGKLLHHASVGAGRIGVLMQKLTQLAASSLQVLTIGLLLFLTLPWVSLAIGLLGLGFYRLTHSLARRVSYHIGTGRVTASSEQATILNEFLNGMRHILLFNTHPVWIQRFDRQNRAFRQLAIQDGIWLAGPRILLDATTILVLFGLLLFLHLRDPRVFTVHLPMIGLLAMALFKLLPSLTQIGQLRMEMLGLLPDAEEVHHLLTQHKPRAAGGSVPFESLRREILFEDVRFGYEGRPPLLKGLSVTFGRGEVTAIVGPSGAGKTTLVHLLLGLLEPTSGRILIDDLNLREYRWESWRGRIGFVPQDPFITHASIAENILIGREGFAFSSIRQAAQIANADEFISEFPQGYETLVGERGMKLSGGQQQRICIARAILHDPEILIFDEATSFLDVESERLIQEAIERLSKGRTVILIAHRLSTVRNADKIVFIDQGRLLEEGNHLELIQAKGRYFQWMTTVNPSVELEPVGGDGGGSG